MSYQKEKRRVRRLEEQLEELRRNKMSPSVTNDGMPHGTDKKDLSDYAVKVDEIEQELVAARYVHYRRCRSGLRLWRMREKRICLHTGILRGLNGKRFV